MLKGDLTASPHGLSSDDCNTQVTFRKTLLDRVTATFDELQYVHKQKSPTTKVQDKQPRKRARIAPQDQVAQPVVFEHDKTFCESLNTRYPATGIALKKEEIFYASVEESEKYSKDDAGIKYPHFHVIATTLCDNRSKASQELPSKSQQCCHLDFVWSHKHEDDGPRGHVAFTFSECDTNFKLRTQSKLPFEGCRMCKNGFKGASDNENDVIKHLETLGFPRDDIFEFLVNELM